MTRAIRSVLRSFYFYAVLGVAGFLLLQIAFNLIAINEKEVTELTKIQERELDVFLAADQLLTTLATLTIGGVTAFVFQRYKGRPVPAPQVSRAMVSWAFSGLSLVCGYLSYQRVEWMLSNHFLNLTKGMVRWPSSLQFLTFALSLLFLLNFVVNALHDAPRKTTDSAEAEE